MSLVAEEVWQITTYGFNISQRYQLGCWDKSIKWAYYNTTQSYSPGLSANMQRQVNHAKYEFESTLLGASSE